MARQLLLTVARFRGTKKDGAGYSNPGVCLSPSGG
jgi:hypothetical protein